MFCRGSLIEMLMKSNCGRYIEFKVLSQIFSPVNGDLEQVPCSRADMFTTKSVSMIDKRKMMRFLSFCAEYESHPEQYQGTCISPNEQVSISTVGALLQNLRNCLLSSFSVSMICLLIFDTLSFTAQLWLRKQHQLSRFYLVNKAMYIKIHCCFSGAESNTAIPNFFGQVWKRSFPLSLVWSRRVGSSLLQVNRNSLRLRERERARECVSLLASSTCFVGCVLFLVEFIVCAGMLRVWLCQVRITK